MTHNARVRPLSELGPGERLNFLLTNRLPRRTMNRFMAWFSKIQNPLVSAVSIAAWKACVDDLRLHEAQSTKFSSMHDCFTRKLKPGARPVDPDPEILVSPCDAVIGAFGRLDGVKAIQAKGFPYRIDELLGDPELADRHRDGRFVTLRLKSSMYHRFHAPLDSRLEEVRYISGDTWNVNPVALKMVENLYCRNERAVFPLHLPHHGETVTMVAVAAILVASIRIHGVEQALNQRYRGAHRIPCSRTLSKGEEIGYFEHGSTIVLLAPGRFDTEPGIAPGKIIRMGQALLRSPAPIRPVS